MTRDNRAIEAAERIIAACEGCRLIGPTANQIAFQQAVRDYRAASQQENE